MASNDSKNIKPLTFKELNKEPKYSEFIHSDRFKFVCTLEPNQEGEKVIITNAVEELVNEPGIVYVMVIHDRILKIGQSINSMKDRVTSYNCGKTRFRIAGTASTTNYFILQSILGMDSEVQVYGFFPPKVEFELFEEKIITSHSASKVAEKKMIEEYIKIYGKKPIGITQK